MQMIVVAILGLDARDLRIVEEDPSHHARLPHQLHQSRCRSAVIRWIAVIHPRLLAVGTERAQVHLQPVAVTTVRLEGRAARQADVSDTNAAVIQSAPEMFDAEQESQQTGMHVLRST